MKANSAECKLSASLTKAEDKAQRIKRMAWVVDKDVVIMHDQLPHLPLEYQRQIEVIATYLYGQTTVKGQG
jgi:hypothetical protein